MGAAGFGGRGEVPWVEWNGWDEWMNGWGCPRRGCERRVGSNLGKRLGSMDGGETTRPQSCQQCPAAPSQLGSCSMD